MKLTELVINPFESLFDIDSNNISPAEEAGRRAVREVLGLEEPLPETRGFKVTELVRNPFEDLTDIQE